MSWNPITRLGVAATPDRPKFIIIKDGVWLDTIYAYTKRGLEKAIEHRNLMRKHYPANRYEIACYDMGHTPYRRLAVPEPGELEGDE